MAMMSGAGLGNAGAMSKLVGGNMDQAGLMAMMSGAGAAGLVAGQPSAAGGGGPAAQIAQLAELKASAIMILFPSNYPTTFA